MTQEQKERIIADADRTYDFNGGEDIKELLSDLDKARAALLSFQDSGDLRQIGRAWRLLRGLP